MTTQHSAAPAGHPLFDLARRLDRTRQERRDRRRLATLDDHRLRDIGLTRADVGASAGPLPDSERRRLRF